MFKLVLKRIFVSLPTLIGVTIVAFSMIRMVPGDPVKVRLGERGGSPEVYQEMRAKLGLDRPLPIQYLSFVGNALRGDLGHSIVSKRPVTEEFFARFPATVELGLIGILIAVLLGIPMGLIAAQFRKKAPDFVLMTTALVGYSMPIFWWGLVVIIVFATGFGWFPVGGRVSVMFDIEPITGFMLIDSLMSEEGFAAFKSAIIHLVLPAFVLATVPLAAIARMTRSSLLEVLREDYIRTARAKGLALKSVVIKHGLRNALMPIVTIVGLMVGSILTGAILTETIFSWPGIGKWLVHSVEARDYPVIQGGMLLTSVVIIAVNIIVDLIYFVVNPLLRAKEGV